MSSAPRPKRFYRDMTPAKAAEIRRLYFVDRLKQHQIGKLYGLAQSSIHRIVIGFTWPTAGGF